MSSLSNSRPLSPHLTIYKPQLTSGLSIFHRAAGVSMALALGGAFFCIRFLTLHGSQYGVYGLVTPFTTWVLGGVLLTLLCGICYHFTNGFRHLGWDLGFNLGVDAVNRTGFLMLAVSACLVVLCLLRWTL